MKTIVFDSSTLISFSETCLINALYFLKEKFAVKLLATPAVQREVVATPMGIRRFEFSALRIKKLFDDRVVEVVATPNLKQQTQNVLSLANNLFFVHGHPLQLVQLGEAECVAAFEGASINAMAVDEKTMRSLIEAPEKFSEQVASEYSAKVEIDEGKLAAWKFLAASIKCVRSAELLAVAGRNGFFKDFGNAKSEAIASALYSLRSSGCAISSQELLEYERMA